MEVINAPPLSPRFTEADLEILKQYFELNKKYYWKINEELTSVLNQHPLWGPILKMQTPEQQRAQNERSLEMQRAAIYEGKWEEYSKDLVTQGVTYARMNVSYADWYEIIKLYKDHLIPYIKTDFANATETAIIFLDGLSKFIDYAMYGIAEAYFKEKNSIIKANEERFRAIFENSIDYIYLIDTTATIRMINHVLPSVRKEDLIGKSIFDFQPEENKKVVKKAIQEVFENKTPSVYDTLYVREEKYIYYSNSISPIFGEDGKVNAAVIISRDVSAQRIAAAKIKEMNTTLERKVNERTEELMNINKELEAFSYSISHDLRSPLRAINGFTQILSEDYSTIMNDEAKDSMKEIIENTKRMGQLIDDLLEFSRLGRQEVVRADLDMNELVASIITELKPGEKERKIEFKVDLLEKTKGDRRMLKQAMMNIMTNALKYSSKKEETLIEIGSYKENNTSVYYVKDNGAGFDMAYYDKLFGVFQRLHSANEFEGIGVGLAIVQRIITKHGGKVWAEGKVGEGATFYLSLPCLN